MLLNYSLKYLHIRLLNALLATQYKLEKGFNTLITGKDLVSLDPFLLRELGVTL